MWSSVSREASEASVASRPEVGWVSRYQSCPRWTINAWRKFREGSVLEHQVINRTVVTIDASSGRYPIQILIQSRLDGTEIQRAPKSLESKARPNASTFRGRARTLNSCINSRTHRVRTAIFYSFRRKGGIRQFIPRRFVTAWHIISTPCRCEIPPIVNTPVSD